MKPIYLFIIISLISLNIASQDAISFSVLQDPKLAFGLDKKHKNDTPTLDLIVNVNWECDQKDYYYFALQLQYEHANLYDGRFTRYSVHGLWNFETLLIENLNTAFGFGLGVINRDYIEGAGSYSFTVDISYPILKNLSVIQKNEWVKRSDLPTPKLGYNLSIGLKWKAIKLKTRDELREELRLKKLKP